MTTTIARKFLLAVAIILLPAIGKAQQLDTPAIPKDSMNLDLTLNKALEIALAESPSVKIANHEVKKVEYSKKGVLASLFPQIDFGADYSRTIKKQVMYMSGSMPGLGGESGSEGAEQQKPSKNTGIAVGRNNTWSLGFSASMPIIAPQLWKQLSITADNVELAVEQSRQSKVTLINNVKQAYYTVMLANDSYDVYKETYQNAYNNYVDISNKFDQGIVSEYDKIRADVAVKNIEPSLYEAENAIALAKWQLKALMGINLDTKIECTESLHDYKNRLEEVYMTIDTTLIASNSSLRQLNIQRKMLKKTKDAAQAEYYPTLGLSISYKWNAMSEDFKFKNYQWDPYSMVALSLKIPIFSSGKRFSALKQAKIDMEEIELNKYDIEKNLMVAVKNYTDKMRTSIKSHNVARAGIAQAQKGYDIAVKRYDTGAGTILEMDDSRLALTKAKLLANQAIFNFLSAKASLEETMGYDETSINE